MGRLLPAQPHRPRNHLFHDFVGAAVDALRTRVDVGARDRVFPHVAIAANNCTHSSITLHCKSLHQYLAMLAVAVSSVFVISSSVHLSMNTCAIWTSVCNSARVKRVFWKAATG